MPNCFTMTDSPWLTPIKDLSGSLLKTARPSKYLDKVSNVQRYKNASHESSHMLPRDFIRPIRNLKREASCKTSREGRTWEDRTRFQHKCAQS